MNITEFLLARISEDEAEAQYLSYRARFLAECAAKRVIIAQAEEATADRGMVISEWCGSDAERAESWASDPGELILKALAAVYKDHPDYQREWTL